MKGADLAQSCLGDLRQAELCCQALESLLISPRKQNTDERSTTEGALLMSAVLLYARATNTQSGRGSSQIRNLLAKNDQLLHDSIIEVRDRAIAHVDIGMTAGGDHWHNSATFIVETNRGWKVGSVSQRIQLHRPTLNALKAILPLAKSILERRFQKKVAQLSEHMNKVKLNDSDLIDPMAYFGSEAAVRHALSGIDAGFAHGYSRSPSSSLGPTN